MNDQPIAMERLEKIKWRRQIFYPVGENAAEMAQAMAWVRSMGHHAEGLSEDGFRYRSVYPDSRTSRWTWVEPGQWLVHMEGENQVPEFDLPHDEQPATTDDQEQDGYYGYRPWPSDEWHIVDMPTSPRGGAQ